MARAKGKGSGRARGKRRRLGSGRALALLAKWIATASVWGVVAAGGLVAWYATDLPDAEKALSVTRRPTVTLLAADGSRLAAFGDLYASPVRFDELPPDLTRAVLATEDRRFYDHFGVDPIAIARALIANLRAGRIVQGGSTITQQVAKNLFLTPERTLKRKVQEVLLALWLEHKFSKDQILTVYLNRAYLGSGVFGVEAAARRYFGTSAREVSLYQSAMLAGMLKAPSRYNPARHPDLAAARAARVLANMVDAGMLTAGEVRAALRATASTAPRPAGRKRARHFADWVLDQVSSYVSPGDRDLTVVTTLDRRLQRLAETRLGEALAGPGAGAGVAEAALVAMAPGGAVRAMVGGRDYQASQFNRATQSLRQPGSAFKPFVYLAGLEAGLTPDARIADAPVAVGTWRPRNFGARYRGRVTVREALAQSINTVAVSIAERTGRGNVLAVARRLGLTGRLSPTPSLALGAFEVSLLELTAAYGTFANGGTGVWAYGINEIRDGHGRVLYRRSGSGPGRVVEPRHVAAMNDMLSAVISEGTGRAAAILRPAAGKTGTSQNFRDAWFVGYTAELVAGVWMGNDDGLPMKGVTGGGLPARLWRGFMTAALDGVAPKPLPGLGPLPARQEEGFLKGLIARIIGGDG